MINSTENSSILPKLNIKRVVPPRFIPLDVFFFRQSGRSINFGSTKGFPLPHLVLVPGKVKPPLPSPSPDGC